MEREEWIYPKSARSSMGLQATSHRWWRGLLSKLLGPCAGVAVEEPGNDDIRPVPRLLRLAPAFAVVATEPQIGEIDRQGPRPLVRRGWPLANGAGAYAHGADPGRQRGFSPRLGAAPPARRKRDATPGAGRRPQSRARAPRPLASSAGHRWAPGKGTSVPPNSCLCLLNPPSVSMWARERMEGGWEN